MVSLMKEFKYAVLQPLPVRWLTSTQAGHYPEFAVHNTYGIKAVSIPS